MAMFRQCIYSTIIWLLSSQLAWAACPSRTYTYTTGQTIDPSQVTTNEDSLFTYGCAVDTFATGSVNAAAIADGAVATGEILDGTIVNADVSASAGITYGKLTFSNNIVAGDIASGAVDVVDMASTGTPADDKVFIADSASAGTWRTIPNCTAATCALQYTQSTNTLSAGTISADVGGTNAARVQRTAGNFTTTSSTLVDITSLSVTITTAANPVFVSFEASCGNDTAADGIYVNIDIDGSAIMGLNGVSIAQHATAGEETNCSFSLLSAALTAASHTIKAQTKTQGGGGTVSIYAGTGIPATLSVMEVVD